MTTHSAQNAHKEFVVQQHLIDGLVGDEGYVERDPLAAFNRKWALDTGLLVRFLQATQRDEWDKLVAHYATSAEDTLFRQLDKELKARGALDVMRNGIKIVPGIRFALCCFRPASGLSPQRVAEYEANILSVMKEVEYSEKHGNRLDIVLFVNGLPVATLEAKNTLTGTTFRHAEHQYKTNRSPAGEPLLTFKRGALVHFAFDEDNVSMTTRLANGKTRFLPFNRGRDGGAGNPDVAGEFRVAYLYRSNGRGKAIFSREVLLDIIGRFMHLERDGKQHVMIFPRFQQLAAVRECIEHARTNGTGHNYLIQHSAGSGKSNTIGWLAHQAINLHDTDDNAVFNTAIIVTDRIVLDRQLQATVSQFEQVAGVVKKIDGTSRQLKDAIRKGARIIVTTIQKFSTGHLEAITGQATRNFAVIIDEAHSSQSGKAAQSMARALTRDAKSSADVEDIIAEYQQSRGPQSNISFFAFTATPRNTTMERFGTIGADGLPHPFHTYSMRQAIEEGFILDVLQNYMTYKVYYGLEKAIEEDPTLSGRKGQRKVARYASLHPTAIGQKVEVIVEHFRRHVMRELDGHAKAMIVTQGRGQAMRYFRGVNKYIEDKGYDDLRALVAFSGSLRMDGATYTEPDLTGFPESELPARFDGVRKDGTPYPEQYQILIVAEKYQTGFDQSKLCAMYVDKKLAGLQTVQTLSRLNRIMPHKKTFVLDFRNTIEDIQTAFRRYFEVTALEAMTDPNQVHELEGRLMTFGILDRDEILRFAATFFKGELSGGDRAMLQGLVKQAVGRFEIEDDEGRQEEFRQLCRSYLRFYTFISQVMNLSDTWLEKLHACLSWLVRMLPDRDVPPEIEVTDDMLALRKFRIEEKDCGDGSLSPGDHEALKAIEEFGAKPYTEDEQKELSEIVKAFNDRHGTEFTETDMLRYEGVKQDIMDDDLTEMLRNNAPDVVYNAFRQAYFMGAIKSFGRDTEMKNIFMQDEEVRERVIKHMFNRAMRETREGPAA